MRVLPSTSTVTRIGATRAISASTGTGSVRKATTPRNPTVSRPRPVRNTVLVFITASSFAGFHHLHQIQTVQPPPHQQRRHQRRPQHHETGLCETGRFKNKRDLVKVTCRSLGEGKRDCAPDQPAGR